VPDVPAGYKKRRLMGEINVVPYIDVMLVLLIIFMVTAPLLTQGVQVELPDADASPISADDLRNREPLVLSVDREGRYATRTSRSTRRRSASGSRSCWAATPRRRCW